MKIKKLIPNKFFLTVLSITIISICLSNKLWSDRFFYITFNTKVEKNTEFQIFYAQHKDNIFSKKQSVKLLLKPGEHKVKIVLPTKKLFSFRIDFGRNSGKTEISDLKILGKKTIQFNDFSQFLLLNIDNHKIENNKLSFNNKQKISSLIFHGTKKLKGKMHIDFYLLIILSTLYFLISYKVIKYLSVFKIKEKHSRIDIVFLTTFFALLFIPMLHISNSDKSDKENRMLAKKPEFSQIYYKNGNFGKLYEQWFNDRFFCREILIDFHDIITSFLAQNGNKRVLIGTDGWLFYKGDNSLRNYQNLDLFSEEDLKKITQYLNGIQQWTEKNHKKFYVLIGPDKNKIYGENIKDLKQINKDDKSRANQLIKYLTEHSKVKVIYPYKELHNAKKDGLLYWKNDTHWNEMGAYIAYKALYKIISKDFPLSIVQYNHLTVKKHEHGDLTSMLSSIKEDNSSKYMQPQIKDTSKCIYKPGPELNAECKNLEKKYRVFIYRDSFTTSLAPYLNNTFGQVNYFSRYDIQYYDLNTIKQNADIIILEIVERNLPILTELQFSED